MKKEYLYSPGPTTVPPEALSVMGSPMFHHRTKRYRDLFKEITDGLKYALATENDVLSFTSSGTAAMESSVANIISPGDRVITVNGGKFGERWGQIARAYNADVDEIMMRVVGEFEGLVREFPTQWFQFTPCWPRDGDDGFAAQRLAAAGLPSDAAP